MRAGQPVATRELFPERFGSALKQRTRRVMGNSLQAWERHGWSGGLRQVYLLWRDRKGLVGSPISALSNVILAYGIATWFWSRWSGMPWGLASLTRSTDMLLLFWTTFLLQVNRMAVRCGCTGRIYGWAFATLVPVRTIWANWINFFATLGAVRRYAVARLRSRPLVWLKTEHMYPSQAALVTHKRPLGEILVAERLFEREALERALAAKPPEVRMGEHLVAAGCLGETELYQALSIQQSVPFEPLASAEVPVWVARALPGAVSRKWSVLPFRIAEGRMYVAGPELPSDAMQREMRAFTRLEIRFQFVTPANFRALQRDLLGTGRQAS
jgi:adsorption protein B